MTPEGKVKAEIKEYLRRIGAYYFMPVQTGYGSTTLDFLICFKGQFIGIEVKRPGVKKGTPMQEVVIELIKRSGGIAFVTDSLEKTKIGMEFLK